MRNAFHVPAYVQARDVHCAGQEMAHKKQDEEEKAESGRDTSSSVSRDPAGVAAGEGACGRAEEGGQATRPR